MCREQKTGKTGYRCEGMVETESNRGAQSVVLPETAEKNGANLLARILHKDNLNDIYKELLQEDIA